MNDTDKLVAAIFAAGICSHPGNKPEDYYAYYETFLKMAKDREEAAGNCSPPSVCGSSR